MPRPNDAVQRNDEKRDGEQESERDPDLLQNKDLLVRFERFIIKYTCVELKEGRKPHDNCRFRAFSLDMLDKLWESPEDV